MRADWAERDSVDPADNMLSYSGRWNVEGDRVYHQVDFSNNSSYIGRRLMRLVEWQENGDILLYSGDPAAAHRRLVWTRARD